MLQQWRVSCLLYGLKAKAVEMDRKWLLLMIHYQGASKFQTPTLDHCPVCNHLHHLINIFPMRYIKLINDRGAGGILKGYCKVKLKGTQIPQVLFWAVTCSINGYIVVGGKWAAGRLFPAPGAPLANSLRKALMTPHCIQTNITHCAWPFLQRSLDTWMH